MTADTPTSHPALDVADQLAPVPTTKAAATREAWLRYYVAQAIGAWAEFHKALPPIGGKPEPGVHLGHLAAIAVASTAAAIALDAPRERVGLKLWALTPEVGALNGEWEEWLFGKADWLGINPADIDHRLEPDHFASPSRRATAAGETP